MKKLLQLGLSLGAIALTSWSCASPAPNASSSPASTPQPTQTPSAIATAPKPVTSPTTEAAPTTRAIAIGDLKELGSDRVCQNAHPDSILFAYTETRNFKIYLCAEEQLPDRPRWYISKNTDGSSGISLDGKSSNPLRGDIIEFQNEGYTYTIEIPSAQNLAPSLRITFPNGLMKFEPLLRYLGNTATSVVRLDREEPLQAVLRDRDRFGICDSNFNESDANRHSNIYNLGQDKYLVMVQCFLAAYQGSYALVLYNADTKEIRLLSLDDFKQEDSRILKTTTTQFAGLPKFNASTGILSNYAKSRGVGDCGTFAKYKFENEQFVLQEYRAKFSCDGRAIDPAQYPLIYPK
ncbi:DUF1176 domain-containing protein [Tumidithrix elongata RA019]|uniref:DUF1176 domain-containing protein n=1 Tax=Tumidithrix elongata BACA0141 TaxID=2716417 RepID=A0AAW9Q617_9CYAN|nr:DUF1176 domain-containing protein [Tumidithrix elongata RA019]